MKTIKMSELKEGNIFCFELKLKGREAFIVEGIDKDMIRITSRLTKKPSRKKIEGLVILLRESPVNQLT